MDDNDNQNRTDPLQPADDYFNPAVDEERLEEDNSTPAADPDDVPAHLPLDHPAGDTDVDFQDQYDAGRQNASVDNLDPEQSQKVFPVELDHEDEEDATPSDEDDETDEE